MVEFKHYKGIGKNNEEIEITIASGPVIVENNKILLDKHEDDFWKFPGGKQIDNNNFLENAKREVKEELGIDVELKGKPCVLAFERDHNGVKEYIILLHYLAKRKGEVKIGRDITEFKWIDVNKLPKDVAPNIKPVLRYFKFIS